MRRWRSVVRFPDAPAWTVSRSSAVFNRSANTELDCKAAPNLIDCMSTGHAASARFQPNRPLTDTGIRMLPPSSVA